MALSQDAIITPLLEITPRRALVDEPVSIRLSGHTSNTQVTLRARMQDDAGRLWESYATFVADYDGHLDLSSAKPVSGTYDEPDGMGLFWSMRLDPSSGETGPFRKTSINPNTATLSAEIEDKVIASREIERLFVAPNVIRSEVRDNGLAGVFFRPAESGPHPALIFVGGSGGGLPEQHAALMASHGFAALALAYFAYEHLPPILANIPLEYFETAIRWLQSQDSVRADRVGAWGGSGGSAAALLIAATFPHIKAVVGSAPSGLIWAGTGEPQPSSFTYRGQPLHFVPLLEDDFTRDQNSQNPIVWARIALHYLEDRAAIERAEIPVEQIQGAVLLISGQDDQVWPSALMSDMVIERLKRHHHPYPYEHVSYAGAGHRLGFPYLPTNIIPTPHPLLGKTYAAGGDPKSDAFARSDSWQQTLRFFDTHLKI